MTVRKLSNILAGMPEDAEVQLGIDTNKEWPPLPVTEYQPVLIARVMYDETDNTVTLREEML